MQHRKHTIAENDQTLAVFCFASGSSSTVTVTVLGSTAETESISAGGELMTGHDVRADSRATLISSERETWSDDDEI